MNAITPAAPVAEIGHNNPPQTTPFDAVKAHVDDLMVEARNWCDGASIENQAQADEVSCLLEEVRKAHKAADEARQVENKPFDDGKAAVQAKYAPLIADTKTQKGVLVTALAALKATLAPWLQKLEEEKRQAALAAQREAEEAARKAAQAMQQARASDISGQEAAQAAIAEAEEAAKAAARAAKDKAHATGGSRAVGLRSYWRADVSDLKEACRHYWTTNPDAFLPLIQQLADIDVRSGKRQIPGVTVTEERRV